MDCHECDEEEFQQWMDIDDEDPGYQIMQDSEILDLMTNKGGANASTSSTTSSDNEDENIISPSEAFTCLDIALSWFETQAESDQHQIYVLKKYVRYACFGRRRFSRFNCTDYPKIPVFRTPMSPN
ncbi:hypothetical protein WA026_001368 [Henosepilachna vigintioctopunctata]|uniref:Uncharacterized protein n=1 Tax=Henosepilachna vigintioctopunctata TaxID=420089 RepID=A0AAW1UUD4_9CUCU